MHKIRVIMHPQNVFLNMEDNQEKHKKRKRHNEEYYTHNKLTTNTTSSICSSRGALCAEPFVFCLYVGKFGCEAGSRVTTAPPGRVDAGAG